MGDCLWIGKPSRYVISQLGRLSLLPFVGRWNQCQLSGWVIIINGDGGCRFWQPVQADLQPKSSGLVLGRRPLGAILHLSNEPGELLQWICHDDSTINIVLDIIIIIVILYYWQADALSTRTVCLFVHLFVCYQTCEHGILKMNGTDFDARFIDRIQVFINIYLWLFTGQTDKISTKELLMKTDKKPGLSQLRRKWNLLRHVLTKKWYGSAKQVLQWAAWGCYLRMGAAKEHLEERACKRNVDNRFKAQLEENGGDSTGQAKRSGQCTAENNKA